MTTRPVPGTTMTRATSANAVATVAQYAQLEQLVRQGYAQHGRGCLVYVTAHHALHPLIRAYVAAGSVTAGVAHAFPALVAALAPYDPMGTYVVLEVQYHQDRLQVQIDIVPCVNAVLPGGPRC